MERISKKAGASKGKGIEGTPRAWTDAVEWARGQLGFEPDPKQARVLLSEARRGMLLCTRQWGKSTVTAAKAVHEAIFQPGSLTLVVSPSARQSREFLRKAAGFVRKLRLAVGGDGDNEISLGFRNGSRIVGLPGKQDTVRGFSEVSLLLIDEASRVQDDMYKTVRPMLAVGGGALWLMSTPDGKRGFFWEEWERGGEGWERYRVPATECGRIPASFLEEERKAHGERWFRQEYMCEFTDLREGVFDMGAVERALTDEVEPLDLDGDAGPGNGP